MNKASRFLADAVEHIRTMDTGSVQVRLVITSSGMCIEGLSGNLRHSKRLSWTLIELSPRHVNLIIRTIYEVIHVVAYEAAWRAALEEMDRA